MSAKELPGILFDWDGVLIDSSSHHEESWQRLCDETGRSMTHEDFLAGFGMKNEFIIPELLRWTRDADEVRRLSLRKEELYRAIILERGISPLPGVREFLRILDDHGLARAIGSSTHRENITTSLAVMGMEKAFPVIVSAEDVTRGKPDPDVFLKAAEAIGKAPKECMVLEDAVVGIQAAHAAGMKAVGVATTHGPSKLAMADRVVRRLDELSFEDMRALLKM